MSILVFSLVCIIVRALLLSVLFSYKFILLYMCTPLCFICCVFLILRCLLGFYTNLQHWQSYSLKLL